MLMLGMLLHLNHLLRFFNTAYNFTVKAYNAYGESIGCDTQNFKTQEPCLPLVFHSPQGPVNSYTPTIKWGPINTVSPVGDID